MASSEWRIGKENYSLFAIRYSPLHARHIELRLLAGAVAAQRAGFADRVGTLEDQVLPCGEPRKDFRFHGLGTGEAQVGFHGGQSIRRETGPLLEEHPDLIVPID